MSVAFALLTSDANLLPCELHRLQERVELDGHGRSHLAGVGWYAQDSVLLRRFPLDAAPRNTTELVSDAASEALLYVCSPVDSSAPVEEVAQPFRYQSWLFAQAGGVPEFARWRPKLVSTLPEFLRRQLRGDTDGEAAFALFLKLLREAGRTNDRALDAALGAQLLSRTVRALQQLAAESGATRGTFNFLATNGNALLATRSNDDPLYYALLEGSTTCERCKLDPSLPDTEPLLRAHRRRRTVAIASNPKDPAGWIELPPGSALAIDATQNVQRLPL
jgi:predicted glutamine amidotransferase